MLYLLPPLPIDTSILHMFGDGHDFHETRSLLGLPLVEATQDINGKRNSYVYSPELAEHVLANPPEHPIQAMLFPGGSQQVYDVMVDYAERGCFPDLSAIFIYATAEDWNVARLLAACPNIAYLGLPHEADFGVNRYPQLQHLICNNDIAAILANCSFPNLRFLEFGTLKGLDNNLSTILPNLRHIGAVNEESDELIAFLETAELPKALCSLTFRQDIKAGLAAFGNVSWRDRVTHLTFDEPIDSDHDIFQALSDLCLPNLSYLNIENCQEDVLSAEIHALRPIANPGLVLDISNCLLHDRHVDWLLQANVLQHCGHVILDGNHILDEERQQLLHTTLGDKLILGQQLEYLGDNEEDNDDYE